MGQNLSRKTAAAKHIFLPRLNMSKKSETIHAYRGWKVLKKITLTEDEKLHLQFKFQLIQSYMIGMQIHTVHRFVLE